MSGAEIIGLISGIIGILDGTPSISAVFRTEHKEEGRLKEEEHLVQTP
jgi:hypothetical protein